MNNELFYTPIAINWILSQNQNPTFCKENKEQVMNEAISFDTEVTSTYTKSGNKIAFMYCWMLDIFDCCIIGRTWSEFIEVTNIISNFYSLNTKRYIIIYIHNLAYDFAMFRRLFKWYRIFATAPRKPLYARTESGIEFRCSYRLSGYKLAKIGEQLDIQKLPDFNYEKIRCSFTPLTKRERLYCIHDVKIVSEYIRRKIKEENGIVNIPLTKTGYVRRLYRAKCLYAKHSYWYKDAIKLMKLTPYEYTVVKDAFAGGFTHAAMLHSGFVCDNVTSYDFASSYPAVLVAEKYPMMQGVKVENITKEEFSKRLESGKCCVFTLELRNLKQTKFFAESYISESKCIVCENPVVNNGRLWKADRIIMTMTNVDYEIIDSIYEFELYAYKDFYEYETAYLPTPFIKCLLELYATKTTLKGVIGKEEEYLNGKENLNASFGMCVTDIVREVLDFAENGDYIPLDEKYKGKSKEEIKDILEKEKEKQINKENTKHGRFLFYLWGVYCTAYARRNLFTGIFECGGDYIYSDTDSIKIMNADKHQDYINRYNTWITKRIENALDYHKLPHELARPKTIKGEEKPLGIWEKDGDYKRFKALRAKAYFYELSDEDYSKRLEYETKTLKSEREELMQWDIEQSKIENKSITDAELNKIKQKYEITEPELNLLKERCKYHMTVAGVNGTCATEYLIKNYKDPFDGFTRVMDVPPEYTGKMLHTFIDEPFTETVTDYLGNSGIVHEESCIHLEKIEFSMKMSKTYRNFLNGIRIEYLK